MVSMRRHDTSFLTITENEELLDIFKYNVKVYVTFCDIIFIHFTKGCCINISQKTGYSIVILVHNIHNIVVKITPFYK